MTYTTYSKNIDTRALQKLIEGIIESAARHGHNISGFDSDKKIEKFVLDNETFRNRLITCTKQSKQIGKLAYELRQKDVGEDEIKTEIEKLKATFNDSFGRLSSNISMEYCISIGIQKRRCYDTDVKIDKKYIQRLETQGKTDVIAAYKAKVIENAAEKRATEVISNDFEGFSAYGGAFTIRRA